MTEYEIEFLTYNDDNEYILSANMDAGQFLQAMRTREEAPEFFVGVYHIRMPDDMSEWEASLIYGHNAARIVIEGRRITVYTLVSTRDIRSFQVTINDSDNDW